MAPLVSPVLFPPLLLRASNAPGYQLVNRTVQSQCGLTRGGPIAGALGAPRWMGLFLHRRSSCSGLSFSPIPRTDSLPTLRLPRISRSLARVYPACSVRPTVRTFAFSPVQSCSPRYLILRNVPTSHTVFSVLLQVTLFISFFLALSFSVSSFLSLFFGLSLAWVQSFYLVLTLSSSKLFFFLLAPTRQHFFRIFRTRYSLPSLSCISFKILEMQRLYSYCEILKREYVHTQ